MDHAWFQGCTHRQTKLWDELVGIVWGMDRHPVHVENDSWRRGITGMKLLLMALFSWVLDAGLPECVSWGRGVRLTQSFPRLLRKTQLVPIWLSIPRCWAALPACSWLPCPQTPSSPAGRKAPNSGGLSTFCLALGWARFLPGGRAGTRAWRPSPAPEMFLPPSVFPCGQISSWKQPGQTQTYRDDISAAMIRRVPGPGIHFLNWELKEGETSDCLCQQLYLLKNNYWAYSVKKRRGNNIS